MLRSETRRVVKVFGTALAAAALAACGGPGADAGLDVGASVASAGQPTVNRYLWTASLATVDFMPLAQVDPVAGVIITDWHTHPRAPEERFRTNVLVLDNALRADALRVSVFKQVRDDATGAWVDASVNPNTAREVENAILTRARQLRLNAIN